MALAGGAGALLARSPGWGGDPAARGEARVFDFSHPSAGRRLGLGRGTDRAASLDAALAAVGGLGAFVLPGDRVVLKVNAGFATAPELGATTHPELVAALTRRCHEAGAAEVRVLDNPVSDPLACFQVSGIGAAAEAAGARVFLPSPEAFSLLTLPGGRLLRDWPVFTAPLAGATRLISVCPLKHHYSAGATMGLKNLYGLLGGARGVFHQDVHGTVAELARLVRPTLTVLDATWAMVRNGPTGGSISDLEERGAIAVGSDPVAVDAFGAGLLGLEPADLPYLVKAAAAGIGSVDWRALAADPGGRG
ncbi:MAG: DUF362 domain-containing protein [Pseudomonadota bacterium]